MNNKLTNEEIQRFKNKINNQGREEYCHLIKHFSCAVFSTKDKLDKIKKDIEREGIKSKTTIIYHSTCDYGETIRLIDGDSWNLIDIEGDKRFNCFGAKFNKLKIDRNIDKDYFLEVVCPTISPYYCEVEFI